MFRIRGIQLSVHFTFLLLIAYVAWEGWSAFGPVGALINVAVITVFFACVVMHELGHSFVAQAFGIHVPRILLLPIGGMAEFSEFPRHPRQEILIALAGPAVNVAIVLCLLPFTAVPRFAEILRFDLNELQLLMVMNAVMGVFNLLPAFPMDGGRVLRALLATRLPYVEATRWAVAVGKGVSLVALLYMAFYVRHLMGTLLFLFILVAGELEYRALLRQEREERRWREFLDRIYGHPADEPRP